MLVEALAGERLSPKRRLIQTPLHLQWLATLPLVSSHYRAAAFLIRDPAKLATTA